MEKTSTEKREQMDSEMFHAGNNDPFVRKGGGMCPDEQRVVKRNTGLRKPLDVDLHDGGIS